MVVVYIQEAHASDTWPMKVQGERPCPKTFAERASYAEEFALELKFPATFQLYIDNLENHFNTAFGSWPTCYYVVHNKKLQYIGECPADSASVSYDVAELFSFLTSCSW